MPKGLKGRKIIAVGVAHWLMVIIDFAFDFAFDFTFDFDFVFEFEFKITQTQYCQPTD